MRTAKLTFLLLFYFYFYSRFSDKTVRRKLSQWGTSASFLKDFRKKGLFLFHSSLRGGQTCDGHAEG